MHGASRNVPRRPLLHCAENRTAVRTFSKPDDRQQHSLFEGAKNLRHDAYIVVLIAQPGKRPPAPVERSSRAPASTTTLPRISASLPGIGV